MAQPSSRGANHARIIIAFVSLYVFWGSTYLGIHYLLAGGFTPFLGAGLRMAIAGAILWIYLRSRHEARLTLRQAVDLAVAGGFLFVGGNGLVMVSQQQLPSGLAATLIATTPFWMAGYERLLPDGERLTPAAVVGIIVGFAGVALLVGPTLGEGGSSVSAVVTCLLAPIFWSLGGLWAKHRLRGLSSMAVTAYEMLFAAVLLGAVGCLLGEPRTLAPVASGWVALAYLVVFGSLFGFTAFVYLMAHVPAAKVATYSYVNPVIAVLLGWAVADEPLTARTLVATAIIIGGVALVNLTKLRRAAPVPRSAMEAEQSPADA